MIHPNTAYKVWISDVLNPENRKSGSIKVGDKEVFRVNMVGSVIMKNVADDRSFASIAVDDSSGQIPLRCWGSDVELLESVNQGEIIQVVGRVAEYNGLIYLRPEVVRNVKSSDDEVLHRAILLKMWGVPSIAKDEWNGASTPVAAGVPEEPQVSKPEVVEEKVVEESVKEDSPSDPSPRKSILSVIEKLDGPEGANIEDVVKESGLSSDDVQGILDDLLKNGEVFMLRPGRVKVL